MILYLLLFAVIETYKLLLPHVFKLTTLDEMTLKLENIRKRVYDILEYFKHRHNVTKELRKRCLDESWNSS